MGAAVRAVAYVIPVYAILADLLLIINHHIESSDVTMTHHHIRLYLYSKYRNEDNSKERKT